MDKDHKISINQRFVGLSKTLVDKKIVATIKEFCEKIDLHQQVLSDIRTNKRWVTIELLSKVLNVYRISPIYILTGEGEIFMQGNMQGFVQGYPKNQNEAIQSLAEPLNPYQQARTKELEEEVIKLKAQNEAYLNVIKALGGGKEQSSANTA